MKSSLVGLRRYLYEAQFHADVQSIQKRSGTPVTVSAARALRAKVDDSLQHRGLSMSDSRLPVEDAQAAFHDALKDAPGYDGVYADPAQRGATNPGYLRARSAFFSAAGFNETGRTGSHGALLTLSPYDPRWAARSTVKTAGASLLYITDDDVEMRCEGGSTEPLTDTDPSLKLNSFTDDGRLLPAGPAYSRDDHSGMTELMGYMTRDEFRRVREWVSDQPASDYMSEDGLGRAKAVLDELNAQGAGYRISRDRNRGQLVAHVTGSKLSVRLTDTNANERFVGRVYDDGIATYFSTNHRSADNGFELYAPSSQETVALLRVAQGLPVDRIDGKGIVGASVQPGDAYFGEDAGRKTARFAFGEYARDGQVQRQSNGTASRVFVHRKSDRSETSTWFGTGDEARDTGTRFLELAVDSARQHVKSELDVDSLISAFDEHTEEAGAGEWFPEFSGDESIAAIQRGYWDVLRGAQTTLLRPGSQREDYDRAVSVLSDIEVSGATLNSTHDMLAGAIAYTGTPAERVREHSSDVLDGVVGTFEPRTVFLAEGGEQVQTFDPAAVANHMSSPYGPWRNGADLTAALRASGATRDDLAQLQGDNSVVRRVRDDLIEFDPTTGRNLEDLPEGGFLRIMAQEAQDTLTRNGVEVESLQVDDNGILDWTGIRRDRQGRQLTGFFKKPEVLHGQVGQLFEQREHGEVVTQFASGENYLFVPGYEARIIPQKAGENLSMEARTRLRGYEQIMAEQIRYQLAGDSLSKRTEIGGPTVLNGAYRRLYDERHEADYLERAAERGLDRGWAEAVLETEGRRVRYPNDLSDTLYESWASDNGIGRFDPSNDSFGSPLVLTGGRNTAVMDANSDGYFDPDLTNAARPGVTRFLVESAKVSDDGRIEPGDSDDRTPVMKHVEVGAIQFDPFDRRQMTGMNLMHASGVTRPRRTALMTFGGWGADDGVVISKEFSQDHQILGKDGQLRDLVVGDKLSDLHGNKGVVSLVVDRERDHDNALYSQDQSMMYAAGVFRDNPELDVVMSPFSAVGRFNGGTARELMQSPGDLVLPFKGIQPALTGEMRFIVTHKDVQAGTRVYDEAAVAQGRGRKASAQLAWALDSQNAVEVLKEFYGPNGNAVANFRETLVSVGLDMEADGTLREGEAYGQDGRRLFAMPDLELTTHNRLDRAAMTRAFADQIGTRGGDMELPFPLKFPAHGEGLPPRAIPKGLNPERESWRLPVLSSQLRTGQTLDDGTNAAHEYTTQYLKISEAASNYRYAQARLAGEFGGFTADKAPALRQQMDVSHRKAQAAFSTITSGLVERQFTGRNNIFKEGLMSSRLPSSATAVWSADPRLDLDEVAMSPTMAQAMGVDAGDHVLIWRDPVLRDAGVRYMRVALDDRLTGVAINPVMDKGFDGDFDGDSVAIVKLHGEHARAEAMSKLRVESNLLDLGALEEINMGDGTTELLHPLMMQDSLDVKVTQSIAPRFVERFGKLTMRANEVHSDFEAGAISERERVQVNRQILDSLSIYYREAMEGQYGDAALSFADPLSHLASVKHACIDTGAKGSPAKLAAYAKHLGVDENGVDQGVPLHTREEDQGVMVATAVKTAVGIAGAFSQRGVRALRNSTQKSVLELTYPVTQSLLQSKHDPHEAMQKYGLLLSSARDLWRGRLMNRVAGEDGTGASWAVATDDKGAELQATTVQWEEQFMDMYGSKDGLNIPSVDPEHVSVVAQALTGTDGKMRDIEAVGSGADRAEAGAGLVSGSTMDRLAYGGGFTDLCVAAIQRENIFDGEHNGHFAPFEIQRNQREVEQYALRVERAADPTRPVPAPEFAHVGARDVLADSNELARQRGASQRSALAATVRAPRHVAAPDVVESEVADTDGFEYGL